MRKLILSTKGLASNERAEEVLNRAFLHADGFFTTLFLKDGKIADLIHHYNRLIHSCKITSLAIPNELDTYLRFKNYLAEHVKHVQEYSRLKIICWRREGKGFQVNENSTIDFALLIESEDENSLALPIHLVDVSIPRIPNSAMPSSVKWLNGMNSILAQKEAKQKEGTLALQTTVDGFVSETALACVVWFDGQSFFTPSKECDVLEGTCLKAFKEYCEEFKVQILEIKIKRNELQSPIWYVLNSKWGMKSVHIVNGIHQSDSIIGNEICRKFNEWRWKNATRLNDD